MDHCVLISSQYLHPFCPTHFPSRNILPPRFLSAFCKPFSVLCHFAAPPPPSLYTPLCSRSLPAFPLSFHVEGKLFPPDFCLIGPSYLHRLLSSKPGSVWEVCGPMHTLKKVGGNEICMPIQYSYFLLKNLPRSADLI